ncbi:MAG: hypothetical protein ACJATQ_001106, partial [Cellvibrionaceae bacterium]
MSYRVRSVFKQTVDYPHQGAAVFMVFPAITLMIIILLIPVL